MTETACFLEGDRGEIFAVAHDPAAPATGEAFVFCHPMAEEKLWTHRVFVGYARALAAAGHGVLRIDLRGNGDSDLDFSESSVATGLADLRRGIDEAKRRWGAGRVHLLGLRFGATLAALAAEAADDVHRLVLWSPIVDGERYAQELLRTNLATQTAVYREVRYDRTELVEQMRQGATVNVDGYALAIEMFDQASAIKLATTGKRHAGPCLIVQIDRQPGRPAPELQQLAATYAEASVVFAQEEPFWKEIQRSYLNDAANLFAVTHTWLGLEGRLAR